MKRFISFIGVALLIVAMTGCGKNAGPVMLYDGEGFTVTRAGNSVIVTDNATGDTYGYTTKRTGRTGDTMKATSNAAADANGEGLHIETAFNLLRIADERNGETVYVRLRAR